MQRLLTEEEIEKIRKNFSDNALLLACQQTWPVIQEIVESVMIHSEDIFCETAWLMDELIGADKDTDTYSLVSGLWANCLSNIGRWSNNCISITDRYTIRSTIFSLVATTLSLHYQSLYCDLLRDGLLTVIEENRPTPKDIHGQQQMETLKDAQTNSLSACADILSQWINEYIDDQESCLVAEIQQSLSIGEGLPLSGVLNTKRAQKYFMKAIEHGYMKYDNSNISWIGVGGSGVKSQLAYFCGKVYGYKHSASANMGQEFPEEELKSMFGEKRLYSLLVQVHTAKKPQKWRQTIDDMFE